MTYLYTAFGIVWFVFIEYILNLSIVHARLNNEYIILTKQKQEKKRPLVITIICIIGIIGALSTIPLIVSSASASITAWYPIYLALGTAIGMACMYGLWMMKKWGAIVYTHLFAVNQVVLLAFGFWNIFLLIPVVIVIAVLSQLSKMD